MDAPANPSRRKWPWAASTIARSFSATMAALDVRFAAALMDASLPFIKDIQHSVNLQRSFPYLEKRTLLYACETFVSGQSHTGENHEDRNHRSGQYRISTRRILPQTAAHCMDRKLASTFIFVLFTSLLTSSLIVLAKQDSIARVLAVFVSACTSQVRRCLFELIPKLQISSLKSRGRAAEICSCSFFGPVLRGLVGLSWLSRPATSQS